MGCNQRMHGLRGKSKTRACGDAVRCTLCATCSTHCQGDAAHEVAYQRARDARRREEQEARERRVEPLVDKVFPQMGHGDAPFDSRANGIVAGMANKRDAIREGLHLVGGTSRGRS